MIEKYLCYKTGITSTHLSLYKYLVLGGVGQVEASPERRREIISKELAQFGKSEVDIRDYFHNHLEDCKYCEKEFEQIIEISDSVNKEILELKDKRMEALLKR